MGNSVAILDTGVFVALFDRSERNHKACVRVFSAWIGKFLTTEPVLTETLYLLGTSVNAMKSCVEFIIKGGASLVPQSIESLSRAVVLMGKYNDTPMDFADATLVVLAEDSGAEDIFTLDRRGFSTYRMAGRKTFKIWPD